MATAVKKSAPLKRVTKAPAAPKPKTPRKTGTDRKRLGVQAALSLVRPAWTTACPDWETRIVANETLTPCDPLFMDSAAFAMNVFDDLDIVDAGVKFGSSRPWFREFAASIFGAYCMTPGHADEGRRIISTFFLLISKKNAKSTLAAGIMLTAIIINPRPEAEFLILSPTKEVADNSWKPLLAAINANDDLKALFTVKPTERTIIHKNTNASLKVVAADTATVVGKKATGVFVDELHEFGKVAKAQDMLVEATGGDMSRPESFLIYASTQSAEPPAGVFKKELDYARGVRDGKIIDPSYLPILYEYPSRYLDRITKPYMLKQNWYITNPNMGVTVDEEKLTQKIAKAGIGGEDSLQSIISKHLNVQIGLDLGADAWPAAALWLGRAYKRPKGLADLMMNDGQAISDGYVRPAGLSDLMDNAEVITAGVDGGGLDDLLALTFTARLKNSEGKRYRSWSFCWVNRSVLELRKEIAPRLQDFADAGCLRIIDVPGDDVKELAAVMKDVFGSELLAGVGIDPARIASLRKALLDAGIPVDDDKFFIKVRQGWSLCSAMWWVERALFEGNYEHSDQPVVDWAVGNAKVVLRGNAMLVTKEISGKAKIDPLMSTFNAAELMSYNPASRTGGYSLEALGLMG